MEIDYSKENIQPLRGGRNVSQLETALQAQSDTELQRELLEQKESFEEAIRTYEGNDPLDNWYGYISWVEQSYPKHGHEGNLVALLEDCVAKFENDERYKNDRRMCKLWIKYIDLQQNPLELFPWLHNKRICISCADLYKAWAYYHEVAGDYKRADAVFKMGLSVYAQPYGELVVAQEKMLLNFAKQAVQGADVDEKLAEKRHALTSLRTYKESHRTVVPTVRNAHQILQPTPGAVPMMTNPVDQPRSSHSNVSVTPYEDLETAGPSIGVACASTTILDIAKKQAFIHKENTLKPGTWKQNIVTKKVTQHRNPSFKVHEDEDPQYAGGIRLFPEHFPMNHDSVVWNTDLFIPEPHDPRHVPMYPKLLVYGEADVEYSLEEIRARKYTAKKVQAQSMELSNMQETMMEEANFINGNQMYVETEQAVQSIQASVGMEEQHEMIHQMHHAQSSSPVVMEHHAQPMNLYTSNYKQWEQSNASGNSINYRHHDDTHQGLPAKIVRSSTYQSQNDPRMGESTNNSNSQMKYAEISRQPSNWTDNTSGCNASNTGNMTDVQDPVSSGSASNNSNYRYDAHQGLPTKMVRPLIYEPQNDPRVGESINNSYSQMKYVETRKSIRTDRTIGNSGDVEDHGPSRSFSSNPNYRRHDDVHQGLPTNIVRSSMYQTQNNPRVADSINHSNSQMKYVETRRQPPNWPDNTIGCDVNYTGNLGSSGSTSSNPNYRDQDDEHQELPTKIVRSSIYQPQIDPRVVESANHSNTRKQQNWTDATITCDLGNYTANMREAMKDINEIWKDNLSGLHQEPVVPIEVKKSEIVAFQIHEDTKLEQPDVAGPSTAFLPRKSVLKPAFQILEDAEDVENKPEERFSIYEEDSGSRPVASTVSQGLRQSVAPTLSADCVRTPFAKPPTYKFPRPAEVVSNKKGLFPVFEDEPPVEKPVTLDDSCTTQTFNFNLNKYKVSTPFNAKKIVHTAQQEPQVTPVETLRQSNSKKVLFDDPDHESDSTRVDLGVQAKLSTIFENSKESRNSSSSLSSGGITTFKTTFYHRESLKVIPEISSADSTANPEQSALGNIQEKPAASNYKLIKMLLEDDLEDNGDVRENTYESPMKNQFKAMSCDSNDASPPIKPISRMDVDFHNLIPNNVEYKMDHESHDSIEILETTPPKLRLSSEDEEILNQPVTDPFSRRLNNALLNKINFPCPKYAGNLYTMPNLPRLIGKKETVCFLNEKYVVSKLIGKGAFANVYRAENVLTNEVVALKLEKPANRWEYYIVQEIRERLTNPYLLRAYMEVSACYISKTASVLVSEYCKFGSLLDLNNKVKQTTGKGLKELVAIYYANEIITIVNALHQCKIIHGDIKPDNFLVTRMPPDFGHPSLKLIDFGSSIDMSLFPAGTSFKKAVNTENFICTEMKDGREWTYQTDIFCIAATIHVLLFDKYMQVNKSKKIWTISQHIPRYMRTDLWKTFFFQMLNIDNCSSLPDLAALKSSFESIISSQSEELQMDMRLVANKFS